MNRGWFADVDEDGSEGYPWAMFLQVDGFCYRLGEVWFPNEQECLDYIRSDVLGLGMFDEDNG